MKILGIVGSPRKNGNTEILVKEALEGARKLGAEVEIINITDLNIAPCDGCESCDTTGKCKIEDDMQGIYTKLLKSDGIIFGSPVYYWGLTAQIKAVIDRTFVFRKTKQLRNKVAGAIVVARHSGTSSAFSAFLDYFSLQRMIPATAIGLRAEEELPRERGGGVIAYADKRGEIRKDSQSIARAQALGKAIVETVRVLYSQR